MCELRNTIRSFAGKLKITTMYKTLQPVLEKELSTIREAGLFKKERIITTPQAADIKTADGREVVNFCANNYLGLSSHPRVIEAAKRAIDTHGFGMSSVRFICGTQDIHKELEKKISEFLGTEDTILYAAAFDAQWRGIRTSFWRTRCHYLR
jgi:glycine C-acetyltransferase